MNLSAEIIVKENIDDIERLFAAEEKEFKNQRAGYKIKKTKDKLVFQISAKDSAALRAVLNSISKLISVYEKTKGVVEK
ncbi:MAG: hypothetical protein KKF46_01335 [Nanoarchaeota archaeon]|nr:hypothetical protein [Nanoarchaeota archaeon]MBU1320976.1 hypothetical protein [Nanoarchaeota archaeon]MBU1598361.1 hypothetical protein [Nanoarchaeota archaeon]MBU2441737.1 hypothetical protein [Nanoarchaeota archaeon]